MTSRIATAYLADNDLRAAANARGENYWDAYLAEISEQLGLCAEPISFAALGDPAVLARFSALLGLGTAFRSACTACNSQPGPPQASALAWGSGRW